MNAYMSVLGHLPEAERPSLMEWSFIINYKCVFKVSAWKLEQSKLQAFCGLQGELSVTFDTEISQGGICNELER